jgi:hypothetical protein
MTNDDPSGKLVQGQSIDLVNTFKQAKQALKKAVEIVKSVTTLSRRETWGVLGFFVGIIGAYGVAVTTSLAYAPIIVPIGGLVCLLSAMLAAGDKRVDLIQKTWDLRDEEVEALSPQIAAARKARLTTLPVLEQKRTWLSTASPDELISYYGLGRVVPETKKSTVVKDEAEGRQLLLEDQRNRVLTLPVQLADKEKMPAGSGVDEKN